MRSDRDRLTDILEAIEKIHRYASRGREAFVGDDLVQVWTVHQLQLVGEAAQHLCEGLRAASPQIPWAQTAAMRNIPVRP